MATSRGGGSSDWQREQAALARRQREAERARKAAEKEAKQRKAERRKNQVDRKNRGLTEQVEQLTSVLRQGVARPSAINIDDFKKQLVVPPLDLGQHAVPIPVPNWSEYEPHAPGLISRMFGGQHRYEEALSAARTEYQEDVRKRDEAETRRLRQVVVLQTKHTEIRRREEAEIKAHNEQIETWVRDLRNRNKEAVEAYLGATLDNLPLPPSSPRTVELIYNPHREQVVVKFELPAREIVPTISAYQYLVTKDEERATNRNRKEIADLYRNLISQIALLCIRDLFASDPPLQEIGFNGHVHAINPATGKHEYPCIISLNVEREDFPRDAELRNVNPDACVRHLKAIISNHPYELEPIEPILDFDLSKYSFVEGMDAVATLDSRPDLLHMSPTNFEHLVRQLFEAQGLEGWNTTQSNDDGVDAVMTNKTSIVGGLAIIQAKRYSIAVGVNHVRELAGAIEEKKAGKGILVTTSWFTAKCWEKAREHGRMELIDGERLVYLIKEHLGKDVLISTPKRPRQRPSSTN